MSLFSVRPPLGAAERACIIGLDCATPELVFERWADLLPNLRRVREQAVYGPLESTIPPITVPAWMCMMTGKDPGTLGIYGFRNRRDNSYEGLAFASSRLVPEPALWDVLAEQNLRTIALGVPLTYPPRPINGLMVTDFLAPNTEAVYTYPPELATEIRSVVGDYILDTREFRTENKEQLLTEIHAMTRQRFQLARHLVTTKPWDLFVMVEMGPDRIHHAFWKYFDPDHNRYTPDNPFEDAIRDYYIALDSEIGAFLATLEPDTRILIVSDHGAKRMDGGFCFNQWLIDEGYLVLHTAPAPNTKFSPSLVDWSRTRAWGDGGYYGRLFLNIEGREPMGIVPLAQVEALKTEITAKLEALPDDTGRPMGNRVYRPDSIYARCRNYPPDLIVYFADLHWRSVGALGYESIYTHDNDTGPDDANHAQFGIFLMADIAPKFAYHPTLSDNAPTPDLSIYDVAPTVLSSLQVTVPPGMGRRSVCDATPASDSVYTEDEEAELARRLEDLGYL